MNTVITDHVDLPALGERIQYLRNCCNLTQSELAECANISVSYMSMIEGGCKLPSLKTLLLIADNLGTTADYLLYGREAAAEPASVKLHHLLSDCSDSDQTLLLDFLLSAKRLLKKHDHITSE